MVETVSTTTGIERRAMGLALTALLLSLAGPIVYMALLDIPMFRSSGLPAWALLASGLGWEEQLETLPPPGTPGSLWVLRNSNWSYIP